MKLEIEDISTEEILDPLKNGAELYSSLTENFISEFVFYDKTLYEWATDLMIKIPSNKDLDLISFRSCLLKLSKNIQIASNYYSLASSMVDAIGGGNSIKKSDLINAIVNNYQVKGAKRPAASVIESMAESYLSNRNVSLSSLKLISLYLIVLINSLFLFFNCCFSSSDKF